MGMFSNVRKSKKAIFCDTEQENLKKKLSYIRWNNQ